MDFQNVDVVNHILNNSAKGDCSTMLSSRGIDSAFRCAIVTGNIALIKLFVLPICLASEFLVEQTFKQYCSLGTSIHVWDTLQY